MGLLSRQAPEKTLLSFLRQFCATVLLLVTVAVAEFTELFFPTVVLGMTLSFAVLAKRVPFVKAMRLSRLTLWYVMVQL